MVTFECLGLCGWKLNILYDYSLSCTVRFGSEHCERKLLPFLRTRQVSVSCHTYNIQCYSVCGWVPILDEVYQQCLLYL